MQSTAKIVTVGRSLFHFPSHSFSQRFAAMIWCVIAQFWASLTHVQTHTHTHTQTHTHAHTHIHTRAHTHENVLSTKETRKAMQWTKLELVRAVNALFVTVCLVISCLRMLCQEPLVVFGLQCSRLTMQVLILV